MQVIFEKAQLLAKKFEGECLSTNLSICKGKNAIKFRCQNNHIFFIDLGNIEMSSVESPFFKNSVFEAATSDDCSWCYKCNKFYQQCEEVAASAGLVVVDGLYSSKINLVCLKRNHTFSISYSKKLQTLSC